MIRLLHPICIDFFVLQAAPKPFGDNVVRCSSFAIHADPHLRSLQPLDVLAILSGATN
jgi:hypothetical protein